MNRRNLIALVLAAFASPHLLNRAFAMAFTEYRANSFTKLLSSGGPIVVHVHADWCPVCRAQIPVMDRVLAQSAYKNVRAVRVNYDREKQFLTDYKVIRQSTIIVFKGGMEIARLSYDADPNRIQQTLERAIA